MPTERIQFECNVCHKRYSDREEAQECEDRGAGVEYPIGCIYGNHTEDAIYKHITFAVAKNKIHEHANWGCSWACRDREIGDSLGEEKCGSSLTLGQYNNKINIEHPTFSRMVSWLTSQKIDVTVWNGEKAIPLKDWLKENQK